MKDIKPIDSYNFVARYMPAMICALPLFFLYFYLMDHYRQLDPQKYFAKIHYYVEVPLSLIVAYLLSTIVVGIGKWLEQIHFHRKKGFPSTYLMLYSHAQYPAEFKRQYRERILQRFGLPLLNREEEAKNEQGAISLLNQASRYLAKEYNQDIQIRRHNKRYGFIRNLAGGAIFAGTISIISATIALILQDSVLLVWSIAFTSLYMLLFAFHRYSVKMRAEDYANTLITLFMVLSK